MNTTVSVNPRDIVQGIELSQHGFGWPATPTLAWLSSSVMKLNRHRIANDAHRSLAALVVFTMMVACGEDTRGMERWASSRRGWYSYPFQQVDRDPWAMPKLFEAPGYDSEWTYTDEEESEEVVQSEPVDQVAEEPAVSLCGNGVLEVGETCDLGEENGHWDEGRSLDALCTLTCQDPVWRGRPLS